VAQSVAPESRIVYVDNDPLVLTHARALLTSSPEGSCDYLDADIRNPEGILETAAGLLDFSQPIALMLMGIMGHFTDDEAYPIVSRLQAGLPPGSYFALYDGASTNEAFNQAQQGYNDSGAVPYYLRSPEQFRRYFASSRAWCRWCSGGRIRTRNRPRSTPTAASGARCSGEGWPRLV
jgi:hypothetical protein